MKPKLTIGVGGGTGSGKTTLSLKLAEILGPEQVLILSQDHYYRDASHISAEQRGQQNFDRPESVDFELLVCHLKQLQAGLKIARPIYDFRRHIRLKTSTQVSPRAVILVEGTLVFAAEGLVSCFDLKLFVDAEPDIRFIRRLKRDIQERGRSVASIVRQHLLTVWPMHLRFVEPARKHADLVISEMDGMEQQIVAVVDQIRTAAGMSQGSDLDVVSSGV